MIYDLYIVLSPLKIALRKPLTIMFHLSHFFRKGSRRPSPVLLKAAALF